MNLVTFATVTALIIIVADAVGYYVINRMSYEDNNPSRFKKEICYCTQECCKKSKGGKRVVTGYLIYIGNMLISLSKKINGCKSIIGE